MAKLRIFQHINALASRQVYLPLYFYDFLHKMLRCLSNNSLPFRSSSPRGHKRLLTRCGTREPSTRRSSTNCAANIGNRERAIRYTTYSHGNETLNFHQSYRRSHSPPLTLLFPHPQPLPFPGAGRAAKRNSPPLKGRGRGRGERPGRIVITLYRFCLVTIFRNTKILPKHPENGGFGAFRV